MKDQETTKHSRKADSGFIALLALFLFGALAISNCEAPFKKQSNNDCFSFLSQQHKKNKSL